VGQAATAAHRRQVDVDRAAHPERLMGAFAVEFLAAVVRLSTHNLLAIEWLVIAIVSPRRRSVLGTAAANYSRMLNPRAP
jgi:hypothetical protein